MRIFAISDIHGCHRTFDALLEKISFSQEDELFLLGDYIDRGPGSKQVLDKILQLRKEQHKVYCLLGNHEIMMLQALRNPRSSSAQSWRFWNGGEITLRSFGANTIEEVDAKYIELIKSMPYYLERNKFIFVHAGLNFGIQDPFTDRETMVWATEDHPKVNQEWLGSRIIVHGHRIRSREVIRHDIRKLEKHPVLGIDNGCVYPKSIYNKLCAIELNSMEVSFQKNVDA